MKTKWAILARDGLLGCALSFLTMSAVGLVDRLPYSTTRDAIHDVVAMPGGLIAGLFYPEGPHTGSGSSGWADVVIASNLAFYAIAWFILIRIVNRMRRGGRLGHSNA